MNTCEHNWTQHGVCSYCGAIHPILYAEKVAKLREYQKWIKGESEKPSPIHKP